MSQDQLATYVAVLANLWPLGGLAAGAVLIVVSGVRRWWPLQAAGVILTAVSIGALTARL